MIVLVPLSIALVLFAVQRRMDAEAQAERAVTQSAVAVERILNQTSTMLGVVVDSIANDDVGTWLAEQNVGLLDERLHEIFTSQTAISGAAGQMVDFLIAVDPDGNVVANAGREPDVTDDASLTGWADIGVAVSRRDGIAGAILSGRELKSTDDRTIGFLAAGHWVDEQQTAMLPHPAGGGVVTLAAGRTWAAAPAPSQLDPASLARSGDRLVAERVDGDPLLARQVDGIDAGGAQVIVWGPTDGSLDVLPILTVMALTAVVAAFAGWMLAGSVLAPIGRAVDAASSIAEGHLGRQVVIGGGGRELVDLGDALNAMSAQLTQRVGELERSRDELRGSLNRLGETLSSSLDLDRTLAVVTETAMETLSADKAALMLFTPERDALYGKVGRGVGDGVPRLRPGQGRLGWVAAEGVAVRVEDGMDPDADMPLPLADEPFSVRQLLVPLVGRGETLGVLSLMREDPAAGDFRQEDLETLQSFAAQAAVALENVLLHEEAQRRSLTDPLTGLWNFRHFEAQAARELQSAIRFERPLSLLVLDVDHFKDVNDRHGHQAGDDVLRELARRIRESARTPDLVARYGGEEFTALLPGADSQGAYVSAERMRRRLADAPYEVGAGSLPVDVTCSIGIASYPEHADSVTALLRRADEALYRAKAAGRNRVIVSGAPMSEKSTG